MSKFKIKSKTYKLDSGTTVSVAGKIFAFCGDESRRIKTEGCGSENTEASVVFLPGWSMRVTDDAVETLCNEFSDCTGNETLAIDSHIEGKESEDLSINFIYEEARAISLFIKEYGLKKIIVVGYSRGGDKAIDVVSFLQKSPDDFVEGLILLDAVGMYKQNPEKLVYGLRDDLLVETPKTLLKRGLMKRETKVGAHLAMRIIEHILYEMLHYKIEYPKRFMREVYEMAEQNPHIAEVRVPVVIMSGAHDLISNTKSMLEEAEQDADSMQNDVVATEHSEGSMFWKREKFLREHFFKQSPCVYLFAPEELGYHGLPFLRPRFVARSSIHALKRMTKTRI